MFDHSTNHRHATDAPEPATAKGTRAALFHLWRAESQDESLSEAQVQDAPQIDTANTRICALDKPKTEHDAAKRREAMFQSDSFEFWD